jgi:hypothetical protein
VACHKVNLFADHHPLLFPALALIFCALLKFVHMLLLISQASFCAATACQSPRRTTTSTLQWRTLTSAQRYVTSTLFYEITPLLCMAS